MNKIRFRVVSFVLSTLGVRGGGGMTSAEEEGKNGFGEG